MLTNYNYINKKYDFFLDEVASQICVQKNRNKHVRWIENIFNLVHVCLIGLGLSSQPIPKFEIFIWKNLVEN